MRTIARLFGIEPADVDPSLIKDLVEIYPEGERRVRGSQEFECYGLAPDDPTVLALVERIKAGGYTLIHEPYGRPKHVGMQIIRIYEESDFEGPAYFQPVATFGSFVATYYRDALGRIRVDVESLKGEVDIASDMARSQYFVPTRVKDRLEASGLEGLSFAEAAPVGPDFKSPARWTRPGEELWELTSTVRMPPVSPRMDCRDSRYNPVDPAEHEGQVLFFEGLYRPPELHYTGESLRAMPPFDLARLFERVTCSPEGDAALIASARFREVCREHRLRVDWIPVRIDD